MTHIVMIVANDVSIDSRVQKTARAAQDAGYLVTVLGAAVRGAQWSTSLNGVFVARAPRVPTPPMHYFSRVAVGVRRRVKSKPAVIDLAGRGLALVLDRLGIFIVNRRRQPYRAFSDREVRRRVREASKKHPDIAMWTARFLRPLVDLNPDVIYVHDAVLLLAGGLAKEELARRGRDVRFIADIHEWWPGVAGTTPARIASRTDLEDEWVPHADKVLTVSDTLAGWLEERWSLEKTPDSVENAALAVWEAAPGRSTIREECGLDSNVPLLVYAGAIAPARGVDVAVDAVADIPGAHLVVVAGKRTVHVVELEKQASARGMADRFHVVPFVPPNSISWYLSSATAGLAPFRRSKSHDSALATKISEYLNGGLPLIVSDCESQARYVRAHGVGEVFTADDVQEARAAIVKVIAGREEYASRITDELLATRTWEYQAQRFVEVLRSVAEPTTPPVPPHDPGPSGLRFSREAIELQTWRLSDEWPSLGDQRQYRALVGRSPARQQAMVEGLASLAHPHTTREGCSNGN